MTYMVKWLVNFFSSLGNPLFFEIVFDMNLKIIIMKKTMLTIAYFSSLSFALFLNSCQDDPIIPNEPGTNGVDTTWINPNDSLGGTTPIDTLGGGSTNPNDTIGGTNPNDSLGGGN